MFSYGFPRHWSTLRKLLWLKLLQGAAAVVETVTGNLPLTLANALSHAIISLTRYGKCEQDGTPTPDAPVDIMTNNGALRYGQYGKNLFDVDTVGIEQGAISSAAGSNTTSLNRVRTSGYCPVKPNTNYTISAVVNGYTEGASRGLYVFEYSAESVEGYLGYPAGWRDPNGFAFTTGANTRFIRVVFAKDNTTGERTYPSDVSNIQLEYGDAVSPYEPYHFGLHAGGYSIGKNLANVNAQTALVGYYISAQGVVTAEPNNWMYQPYIRVKPNTTYTLSMSQSVYFVSISEYSKTDDIGFIVRKNGSTGTNTSLTITTEANTNYIRFGSNLNKADVTLANVLAINWQFEEGATATDYEPYTEIPYLPEVLTVSGANLLDPSIVPDEDQYIMPAGGKIKPGGSIPHRATQGFIPIKGGATYKLGYTYSNSDTAAGVAFYTDASEGAFVRGISNRAINGANGILPTRKNYKYMRFSWRVDEGYNADWEHSVYLCECVNNEPILSSWQPYVAPQTVTVPMLLSVGDAKDEVELIHGLLTHKIGVYVVKGTDEEMWTKAVQSGTTNFMFYMNTLGPAREGNANTLCTVAKGAANSWTSSPDIIVVRSNRNFGFLNPTGFTKDSTVEEFQAKARADYLAGKPWIIVYAAHRETTEQTTAQHLVTHEGTNIVDSVANVGPVEAKVEYMKAA